MITSKLPNIGTTIFTRMSQLANEVSRKVSPTLTARRRCSMPSPATCTAAITNTRR